MPYAIGPYDSPHIYIQWGGKLPGNETWSNGVRMRRKTGTTVITDAASLLVGVGAALVAFHGRSGTKVASGAKLSYVKVNAIDLDGTYLDKGATTQAAYADVAGFGGVVATPPNQLACAVTWTTGFSRGPAHSGRFFLPTPSLTLGTDGLVALADAQAISGSVDTLLTDLNNVNANFELAVFSRKAGAAGNRRITGNLVGRVLDTQRRRRRSLIENYA